VCVPVAVVVILWIPLVLWLDRTAGETEQALLGIGTWALLVAILWRATPLLRVQTLIVIAFATAIEYIFSAYYGVYVYRLDHVPPYVPPGHGLVYLAALAIGSALAARGLTRAAVTATIVIGAMAATWGLVISARPDALGAFWYLCLVGFLIWGRNRGLYVGAFIVVTWLEVLGTAWGVWRWMPRDTIASVVPMGNPPSVAAGGYGWFDLAAVALAPMILTGLAVVAGALGIQRTQSLVVQQAVGADGTAGLNGSRAVEPGDLSAGLDDNGNQSRDIPRHQPGFSGDVDSAFSDQHV